MLRPATPLTLAFLVAFVLLLLSTISTPLVANIPLGSNRGVTFGVFGYCSDGSAGTPAGCSNIKVGYDQSELDAASQSDFQLQPGTRATLSYILIVHPIAALMVLICTILAAASHFRGPAHSPRFLLGLLIFTFPTLLVTLLAFLVDILLFIPHMQWGGWIVLPATLIVTACGVLTCAMRRTLVSRKARKRRIAENADMNGSNYYAMKQEVVNRPQQQPLEPEYARAESPPPLNQMPDSNGVATYDKVAPFAAGYEYDRSRPSMDDRTPLNMRDPSLRSMSTGPRSQGQHMSDSTMIGGNPYARDGMRDDQAEPVSPLEGQADPRHPFRAGAAPPYGRGGAAAQAAFAARGRGGLGGFRPRGGPGPGPDGRGYNRGGYRGDYSGDYRGGRGRGGPPPPGWNGRGGPMMRGRPPPPGYAYGYQNSPSGSRSGNDPYGAPPMGYSQQQEQGYPPQGSYGYDDPAAGDPSYGYSHRTPPGSARHQSPGGGLRRMSSSQTRDPTSFGFSGRQPSPARSQTGPRSDSPPPPLPIITDGPPGQAIELDHRTGSPAQSPTAYDNAPSLNQLGELAPRGDHSAGTYLPRGAWQSEPVELGVRTPPATSYGDPMQHQTSAQPHAEPPVPSQRPPVRGASDGSYYEDIEPRFSQDHRQQVLPQVQSSLAQEPSPPIHSSLMPGYHNQNPDYLSASNRDDTTSPAHSDNSNFTSISQRGINPEWQPPASARGPPRPRRNDAILASNPDFMVPAPGRPSDAAHLRGGSGNHRYPDAA